ncbi:BlaI/MecI/CopY family transcriptional regulator [Clostridium estertheticum]|uniref:BlaI/MecI/CopY family transcriptional regulator n=1 Tax=Clostridium estertheticum TaxID=238834 RepID=UPI00124ED1C7|nr:BlaI/MecI/CopY family transcriptional regulator [Clostridium estertheticum]MBZ9618270.1 BlaI/MecI/CopY family transcriptional regulator [Clostridium estertheticum subsp. laramiense]WAG76229.1 BlaI/MecI/CopY family transcriptional regulator [Clostridium estertheticum]
MYKIPKITNAEWEIMKIIWINPKITAINITNELNDKFEWKLATVKTLINRLLTKSAIGFNKVGYEYLYFPLVSENECIKSERKSFINRVFNGSMQSLLLNFTQSQEISETDIEELITILEQSRKTKG